MFSQVKALVQQMLGPAYDYVMPLVGILIPFRYPGNFYWLFCLSTLAIALVLYVGSATDGEGRSLKGFWRFLAPREVYVTRSAWVDGQYYVVSSLVNMWLHLTAFAFALGSTLSTAQAAKLGLTWLLGPGPEGVDPTLVARIAYSILWVAAADLAKWITHFLQHKVPYLWEFHKLHHSATVLTPLTNLRVHPVDVMFENFLTAITTGVVAGAFGYAYSGGILEITILGTSLVYFFSSLLANLRHSHIPLYYNETLSRFLSSPAMHHVHHSCESKHFDKNFAVVFSLWDHLAGTNYIPARGERFELGIGAESAEFSSLWRAYFYPFYSLAKKIRQQIAGAAAPQPQPEMARATAPAPEPTNQPLP